MKRLPWQGCLSVGLLLILLVPQAAPAQQIRPAPPVVGPVEYPLGLVAFASIDRLMGRADSLAEALGEPGLGDQLLNGMLGGDEGVAKLLNAPGLDTNRPFGAMFYPKWLQGDLVSEASAGTGDSAPQASVGIDNEFLNDPLSFLLESAASMFVEDATFVLCLPVKNRQQIRDVIGEVLADKKAMLAVDEQPGWFQFDGEKNIRVGFVGSYLLLVNDDSESKQFYRNYPEFDKVAKGSLGKNGFVYALYRRGLPPLVRDAMLPAFKMAFAAQFQRQDDESEADFRMRTMFGSLQMDLVDLALSHVEEFRIGGHVDSATRTIIVEPELVGPKDGKLAKYCNSCKLKGSPFTSLSSDDASLAATVALPLPAKLWGPVVEALNGRADLTDKPEVANFIRALAKTVESGQLDLHTFNPNWQSGLIALRVNGNAKLPEQFPSVLQALGAGESLELNVDSVEGIAIHRVQTSLAGYPLFSLLPLAGMAFQPSPLVKQVRVQEDAGDVIEILENQVLVNDPPLVVDAQPALDNSIWLAATPQVIWFGYGPGAGDSCPDWFKSQIAASLTKPTAANRNRGPFQLTLRGLGASSSSEIELAGAEKAVDAAEQANLEREKARADILRDLPNAVHIEVIPTATGTKLGIRFEEAYFQWFATYVKDSLAESRAAQSVAPPVAPAEPPPLAP